jgi:hypothetical protein
MVICSAENCSEFCFCSHETMDICFLYRYSGIQNFGIQGWPSFLLKLLSSMISWTGRVFDYYGILLLVCGVSAKWLARQPAARFLVRFSTGHLEVLLAKQHPTTATMMKRQYRSYSTQNLPGGGPGVDIGPGSNPSFLISWDPVQG